MTASDRRICRAPTADGGRCRNYADTCPHESHQHRRGGSRVASSVLTVPRPIASAAVPGPGDNRPKAHETSGFNDLLDRASRTYGLSAEMVAHDYWLVSTLHAWTTQIGARSLPQAYPAANRSSIPIGRVIFGGGTSLSVAWGITERWSEDIDLVFEPDGPHRPKKFKAACKAAAITVSKAVGGSCRASERGKQHFFFEVAHQRTEPLARVDIVAHESVPNPVLCQYVPVTSLVGRVATQDELDAFPEMGGFDFLTLGPGSTAMNKLLAQTQMSESGDLNQIRERARDVYDLACIARSSAHFDGHIGRDSSALLYIAEQWSAEAVTRPRDGFASLASFRSGTREHQALAEGYEAMLDRMVYGEKIAFDEAVRLAVSLDPGPARQFVPQAPGDHHGIGYRRLT